MIRKLPKKAKRDGRFRSQRHLSHIRSHTCAASNPNVCRLNRRARIANDTGMGQKPHDYECVSLCRDCHQLQHTQGERTFWQGRDVQAIMGEFIRTSPVRREIEAHRNGER